jgi:PAS domain S-box-containing protein
LNTVLRSIGDAVIACDANGYVLFMNGVAEELTGWLQDEAFEEPLGKVFRIVHEETRRVVESPVDKVRRLGTVVGLANHTVLIRRDGSEISIDDSGAPIHDREGVLTGVVLVFRNITERRRTERNLQLLSDSGRELARSLDFEETLKNIAVLCNQSFSDFCYFDLVQPDGSIRRTVRLHRIADQQGLLDEASSMQLTRDDAAHPVNRSLASGEATRIEYVTDEWLQEIALNERHLRCIRELKFHTLMSVPVKDGERQFGTLSFCRTVTPGPFTEEDCNVAQELAIRVAAVLENADLYRTLRAAQDQTKAEKERLRDLFMQAPAPILTMTGPDLVVTLANPLYVRLLRRKSEKDLVGKTLREALPELEGQGFFELLDGVYRTGVPYVGNELVCYLDNEVTGAVDEGYFNFVYQPSRTAEGVVDGVMVFAIEITEQVLSRKELEKSEQALKRQTSELETVYKTAPIGLALFDPVEFRYLRLNDTQAQIVGKPASEILGRTLTEIAPIEGLNEMFEGVAKGTPLRNALLEGELPEQPGAHRYWTVNYFPVYNEDGTVQAITAASLEITAQKRAEQALIQNEKIAAVGRLASSIAHEINNPLESITNLLYIARHTEDAEEIHSYLEIADRELRRISLIASQTLRFYRQSTRPQAIQAESLVKSVLTLYQGRLVNSGIVVETRPWVERGIVCFEGEIRQVLNNLVGNALDAMPHGGRLLIRSREATDWATGRKGMMLTFADTGSGIPQEAVKKIFEAFFTTKGMNGTGLGLWISKEIVERHQGWMRVRSRVGGAGRDGASRGGTVFCVFLPFDAVLPETAEAFGTAILPGA